jgi:hypothetical protein
MWLLKQISAFFIFSACLGLNLNLSGIGAAHAQSSESSEQIIAQTTDSPETPRRRIKPSFFEEERRQKFGFGDFLDSALNGVENTFGADDTTSLIQNIAFDTISIPVLQGVPGTLTVSDFKDNDNGFLNTTFTGEGVTLTFTNSQPNSDQRTGTIEVDTLNGSLPGLDRPFKNEVLQYNAGFSNKGNDISAVFLIVDPNDPNRSIFIQLPRTTVEGADDLNDDDDVVSGRASLSIGLPSDR